MGSTILRALARQGHPTSPAGLRTYREAARANPCVRTLVVSRACKVPILAREQGPPEAAWDPHRGLGRYPNASAGTRVDLGVSQCRGGLTVPKVCTVARRPVMRSTQKPQDTASGCSGQPWRYRRRAPAWPNRLNALVGQWPQKPSLWPPPTAWPRGSPPTKPPCRRRTAQSSATSTPSA